jgi:small subunit ribosomal protein S34
MSSKPQALFNVVNGLRHFGVGAKVTRSIYKFPDTYWILTKVKLSKDQSHGKAWGRLIWRGRAKEKDEKIGCPLKTQWTLVGLPDYKTFDGEGDKVAEIIKRSSSENRTV